jgi:hypothetical protein
VHTIFFVLFATFSAAHAAPIPELAQALQGQVDQWNLAAEGNGSSRAVTEGWDYEQFYLQVNPYVSIGVSALQIQILPEFGFLWLRDPPNGCQPYDPTQGPQR